MQTQVKRHIKKGWEHHHLFPKVKGTEVTIQRQANVGHTVRFIPKVVLDTLFHTKYLAPLLKGNSIYETCENIWQFVYDHIAYKKDEDGKEQVRSPARVWNDRFSGVDCDCYTVFISSVLTNLHIPHKLRITKYSQDFFQHIYPIVPLASGDYITIDCVVEEFNYEEPYTQKQDYNMDLTYLNGVPQKNNPDAELDEAQNLGKLFDFLKKKTDPVTGEKKEGKLKQVLKKGLHVINKVNPATLLLRNGVLAAMKLNFLKVPQRLKYAYLSDAEAQKRGIDMQKFAKLKQVKDKLEKIFYGAGGQPENLKSAILTGKGNEKREVSGLGYTCNQAVLGMNEKTPLEHLLGQDIYYSENMEGLNEIEGLNGLGEPVTAASVGAASGVLAAIAALLKSIGNLFPNNKAPESADFNNIDNTDATVPPPSADPNADLDKMVLEVNKMTTQENISMPNTRNAEVTPTEENTETKTDQKTTDPAPTGETFWDKNKKWIKPTAWVAGGLTVLGLGYAAVKKLGKSKKSKSVDGLSGTPKEKKKQKPKKKGGQPKKKVKTVTLK